MTSSSSALTEFRSGSLYFFDQPTKRHRIRGARSRFLYSHAGAQVDEATQSGHGRDSKEGESAGAGCMHREPDLSLVQVYRCAAPRLLQELNLQLCLHRSTGRSSVPHGIVNILDISWQDLSAGVLPSSDSDFRVFLEQDGARPLQEAGRRKGSCEEVKVDPSVRKPQLSTNPPVKKRKPISDNKAHDSATITFSISSSSCTHPSWITEPETASREESQWIRLCQWAGQRLQEAQDPQKLQRGNQDLRKPLLLRHYGDLKTKANRATTRPQTEAMQQEAAGQKLHYTIDDGSSFIYYPSGCVAVCHSSSGLPCGGFYTNVFSDDRESPEILATITAFGRGSVTKHRSSAVTAVWDQDGGFTCDQRGNKTREWSWQTGRTQREKIVLQVSDLISVTLLSGSSAMLRFRCDSKRVQLPLLALSTTSPSNQLVSACSRGVVQMVGEVEGLEEPSVRCRRGGEGGGGGGQVGRELRRLRQRVRKTLDDWLDYYRVALGIRCPDTERMPGVPLRSRLRREEQNLPSLNPPERAEERQQQQEEEEEEEEKEEVQRQEPTPAERPVDCSIKLRRTKKQKENPCVTQIGPLRIYGNIKHGPVIFPNNADLQTSPVPSYLPPPSFSPSARLAVCPALLRSALRGEEDEAGRRRCCCSAALMPVLTDLEYDAFVLGQPAHSQQVLVVCVALQQQTCTNNSNTPAALEQELLEQIYRSRNKQRSTPCTQCQLDSFRLLKYEVPGCGAGNTLLQQRHGAAPGMVLMYMRGKLLFVGYVFSGSSRSVRDLQKQITRSRGDYRLGLSLPSDYRFSDAVKSDRNEEVTQQRQLQWKKDRKQVPEESTKNKEVLCMKPKKTSCYHTVNPQQ